MKVGAIFIYSSELIENNSFAEIMRYFAHPKYRKKDVRIKCLN